MKDTLQRTQKVMYCTVLYCTVHKHYNVVVYYLYMLLFIPTDI